LPKIRSKTGKAPACFSNVFLSKKPFSAPFFSQVPRFSSKPRLRVPSFSFLELPLFARGAFTAFQLPVCWLRFPRFFSVFCSPRLRRQISKLYILCLHYLLVLRGRV
jgi:hypothetical protein